jgi:hypothetical protein
LIIAHAIPEHHENSSTCVKPNTMIATMNANIEGLLPLPSFMLQGSSST